MILRNCEWVKEPDEGPPQGPRKRLRTEAQAAASRANGAKSKGPTTDTGREKVKFNAVQHGAACKEIVFLDADEESAFWVKVDRIVEEEGAVGELELDAIKTAVYSRVTKNRAINAQAIAVNEKRAQIQDHFGAQKQAEMRDLIPNLVKAPDVTVTKLMNSTYGCTFLIREFQSIAKRLTTHTSFEVSQREYCLRLAGHRPEELFTDPVVRDLNRAYLASLHGPGFFTPESAANAFMYDRPKDITETEFERRMEPFVKDLVSVADGWEELKEFVDGQIKRLKERKELMGYREERQLKAALGVAQSPCDRDGQNMTRCMNQSDRIFFAAVRSFQGLKDERRKHGRTQCQEEAPMDSPEPKGSETASVREEMDPPASLVPAVDNQEVNEPETAQVVAQPTANNAPGAGPASAQGPRPQLTALDHAASRAEYRRMIEKTMRDFNECTETGPPGPSEDA
jgi:hypothetical protein